MTEVRNEAFKAEVSEVLSLVVNSLYSNKEIFLRELISNASDALDKLRFRLITQAELHPEGTPLVIRLLPDKQAKTLTLWDNGEGMSEEELVKNLGTIAHSGTREVAAKLKEAQGDARLIGQFGVGFYSAYLVADRVDVISRAAGSEQAFKWSSDAKQTFSVSPDARDAHGTSVTLHLKDECSEYLDTYRLRELVRLYSDYINYPIELAKSAEASDAEDEDAESEGARKSGKPEFERINQANALWQRSAKDVTDEQYEEFYKHLTRDWEAPVARRHFQVEGVQQFSGLLFLPKRPAFDLYDASAKHGVRLYVRRVFIMEDCEELLPRHLRFVRGVVDSEDLPLNVSREILQDSRLVRTIKKQIVNHALGMLEELAEKDTTQYAAFWGDFGAALKEGLHFASDDKERIQKLVRYESSKAQGITSLAEYVGRMAEGQKAIYYALGPSKELVAASPHLEGLKKRGFEVLYMTDPIDSFAVETMTEFDSKPMVNAMKEKLDLGDAEKDEEQKEANEQAKEQAKSLLERFRGVLDKQVKEVKLSERLTDSPVCLVIPEGGLPPYMERMLQGRKMNMPASKRIFEINPTHPVIAALRTLHDKDETSSAVKEWIEVLYDQALIAEGSPVEDPARFAQRLTKLVGQAAAAT